VVIEERRLAVAVCDACGHKDYPNEQGEFLGTGYVLTIDEHETDTQHEAYACRETHIGKAARAVLERFRSEGNGGPWRDEDGPLAPPPPDAPPLPEHNGDATAATL
jgi:hypothetical protein